MLTLPMKPASRLFVLPSRSNLAHRIGTPRAIMLCPWRIIQRSGDGPPCRYSASFMTRTTRKFDGSILLDTSGHTPSSRGGNIPVSGRHTLDHLSLRGAFTNAVRAYVARGAGDLTLNLLSPDPFQTGAVYDAWALSRSDPKYLLIMRRFIMDLLPESLRRAIWLLSHVGSHPNIFWTKDNWIKPESEMQLLPSFRWSPEEIAHMLRAVEHTDYGGGTLGECLDVLLYEDANVVSKLHITIKILLKDLDAAQAVRAATLALTHSRDQREQLAILIRDYPTLMGHEWFQDIVASVQEGGNLSFY